MLARGGENVIHNFSFDFMPIPAITSQDSSLSEHTSDTHTQVPLMDYFTKMRAILSHIACLTCFYLYYQGGDKITDPPS